MILVTVKDRNIHCTFEKSNFYFLSFLCKIIGCSTNAPIKVEKKIQVKLNTVCFDHTTSVTFAVKSPVAILAHHKKKFYKNWLYGHKSHNTDIHTQVKAKILQQHIDSNSNLSEQTNLLITEFLNATTYLCPQVMALG